MDGKSLNPKGVSAKFRVEFIFNTTSEMFTRPPAASGAQEPSLRGSIHFPELSGLYESAGTINKTANVPQVY